MYFEEEHGSESCILSTTDQGQHDVPIRRRADPLALFHNVHVITRLCRDVNGNVDNVADLPSFWLPSGFLYLILNLRANLFKVYGD